MAQFVMPKLSDTMEEGTILQWIAADGDAVEKGQAVVEIETDKANMTVEAPESGTLRHLAGEGDVLEVGAPMAEIGEGAAPEAGATPQGTADEAAATAAAAPGADAAREVAEEAPTVDLPADENEGEAVARDEGDAGQDDERTEIPLADDGTAAEIGAEVGDEETYPGARAADEAEAGGDGAEAPAEVTEEPAPARAATNGGSENGDRVKASPLARRLAGELGVERVEPSAARGPTAASCAPTWRRPPAATAPPRAPRRRPLRPRPRPPRRAPRPLRAPGSA